MSDTKDKGLNQILASRVFHERMVFHNSLDDAGFEEWIFHPAMLFGSYDKWWGDLGKRGRAHEGLDLCLYRTGEGNIYYLNRETEVPVICAGQVVKVNDDFLGESVFVSHSAYNSNGCQLHTIYGHIKPHDYICSGERVGEGDIIGSLTDARKSGGGVPYHLHISIAWIPKTFSPQELGWQTVGDNTEVVLLDPLRVIECPYSIKADV
ncbi:MAG: peptidoglycan DD-metalloendopeptidase family protein [Dehalococcoidia bacterium]